MELIVIVTVLVLVVAARANSSQLLHRTLPRTEYLVAASKKRRTNEGNLNTNLHFNLKGECKIKTLQIRMMTTMVSWFTAYILGAHTLCAVFSFPACSAIPAIFQHTRRRTRRRRKFFTV